MRFTLRQLRYFIAAGEAESIAGASKLINVSSPSISSAIAQLEAELKLQLFVRHHAQGLSLTPEGTRFLREAKRFIDHGEELQNVAGELSDSLSGLLEIGCFVTLAPIVIPELCHSFTTANENLSLQVREHDQSQLLEMLRTGKINAALTYDLHLSSGFSFHPLASLRPYVLLPADHTLAQGKDVSLEQLSGEPMIMLDLPLSREYFMSMFIKAGISPHIFAQSTYPDVVRGLVARGYGYSLANVRPKNMAALDGRPLAYVSLKGDYPPMAIGIVTIKDVRQTLSMTAFIEHCRTRVTDETIPGMIGLE